MDLAVQLLIFLISTCSAEFCSIHQTGELAITNRILTWDSPVNTLRLEKQVKAIQKELRAMKRAERRAEIQNILREYRDLKKIS